MGDKSYLPAKKMCVWPSLGRERALCVVPAMIQHFEIVLGLSVHVRSLYHVRLHVFADEFSVFETHTFAFAEAMADLGSAEGRFLCPSVGGTLWRHREVVPYTRGSTHVGGSSTSFPGREAP